MLSFYSGADRFDHGIEFDAGAAAAKKVADGLSELETYIDNNRELVPNFGERYRQGETISTAFVESTINQVVSSALRQEATNELDAERSALVVAAAHEGSEQ